MCVNGIKTVGKRVCRLFLCLSRTPTWVCQHEFANLSLPCEGRFRPVPNAAPLMCRTKLNTVRLWSDFGAMADSDDVLALDLIREGHGKQFSIRIYAFTNSVQIEKLISRY